MRYIPVSFMQTIKSFTPATTVILQWLVWSKHFEWRIWASLVPIVGGILLTSMTELSFNIFGFCAAMIGCLATCTKTILAESLLQGYKFDSINTAYYMAPFATMILALPSMLLEGGGVIDWFYTHDSAFSSLIIIPGSGVLAFCLNFSIFYVIHSTTAVTFNVAGNLKVVVVVLVSWLIFRNPISPMNAIGCAITLVSCTFYGYVRHLISQQKAVAPLGSQGTNSSRSGVEMLPLVGDNTDFAICIFYDQEATKENTKLFSLRAMAAPRSSCKKQEGLLTPEVLEREEQPMVDLGDGVLDEIVGDNKANGGPTADTNIEKPWMKMEGRGVGGEGAVYLGREGQFAL
ncbi:UDP-galactose transporter 1-like [Hordeum vulgare]|nr:UDP-galactose transporter 1-like [Hordeum vulgare]